MGTVGDLPGAQSIALRIDSVLVRCALTVSVLMLVGVASGCGERRAPVESGSPTTPVSFVSRTATEGARMRDVVVTAPVERDVPSASRGLFDLTAHCNLDRVGGRPLASETVALSRQAPALLTGWLVDPRRGTAGSDLRLVIAGIDDASSAWTSRSVVRKANPGALAARGYQPSMLESSFAFQVDMKAVPPGEYAVYVVFDEGSGGAFCDPGRRIRLLP